MQQPLPDEVYRRVFQQDADGRRILEELAGMFHDQLGYVPAQIIQGEMIPGTRPEDAVYYEGQRSVLRYLFQRSAIEEG